MKAFTQILAVLACLAVQHIRGTTASPMAMPCPHNNTAFPTPAGTGRPARTAHGQPPATAVFLPGPPRNASVSPADSPDGPGHGSAPPGPASAPAPCTTPAPNATAAVYKKAKFVQTTYYSCVTRGHNTHCGWHEPILDASTSASDASRSGRSAPLWLLAVAGLAIVLVF